MQFGITTRSHVASAAAAAGSQVISAKRGGSCCIKFLVAAQKYATLLLLHILIIHGARAKLLSAATEKKLIAYLQASKLPPQQQTNRKLISSLTKFLFSELACVSPGYYLSSLVSSHLSVLSDRLGFHVDVPQKAFKKFLITPNLKQLMNASLGPLPPMHSPQPLPSSALSRTWETSTH